MGSGHSRRTLRLVHPEDANEEAITLSSSLQRRLQEAGYVTRATDAGARPAGLRDPEEEVAVWTEGTSPPPRPGWARGGCNWVAPFGPRPSAVFFENVARQKSLTGEDVPGQGCERVAGEPGVTRCGSPTRTRDACQESSVAAEEDALPGRPSLASEAETMARMREHLQLAKELRGQLLTDGSRRERLSSGRSALLQCYQLNTSDPLSCAELVRNFGITVDTSLRVLPPRASSGAMKTA